MQENFDWVKRIIESCTNPFQLQVAKTCVALFKERFGECEEYNELLVVQTNKDTALMVA